jgi:hypothetical protein
MHKIDKTKTRYVFFKIPELNYCEMLQKTADDRVVFVHHISKIESLDYYLMKQSNVLTMPNSTIS